MVQVLKTFISHGFLHGPGKGVQIPGAVLAEDLFFQVKIRMAHFARRGIKKTDESFSVVTEHGSMEWETLQGRRAVYGGRYFLCLRTGFPYNTASINPHTREGETEC